MQKKILIVEDDDDSRDLLMQSLEGSYELVTAKDGCEAIEQAVLELPDLILMDLRLPKMDGWQTTLRLKADPQLTDIPVIAMTAHGLSEDETRAPGGRLCRLREQANIAQISREARRAMDR